MRWDLETWGLEKQPGMDRQDKRVLEEEFGRVGRGSEAHGFEQDLVAEAEAHCK
jgi:hypothetical protein